MQEAELPELRIRNVKRDELQCDLCEWRYLVPEHEDVMSVAIRAHDHWANRHELRKH